MARSSKGRGGRQSKGSGGGKSARPQTKRHFPRTARLNALLLEIVAGVIERIDDERFDLVTVTGVEVDNDLNKAEVFISTLDPGATIEEDEAFIEALTEYRKPVQAAIARQAKIRKTPEVVFLFDPAIRAGARIEEILSTIPRTELEDAETEVGPETEVGVEPDPGPASDPESESDLGPESAVDAETEK